MLIGYARVSTEEQSLALQEDALKKALFRNTCKFRPQAKKYQKITKFIHEYAQNGPVWALFFLISGYQIAQCASFSREKAPYGMFRHVFRNKARVKIYDCESTQGVGDNLTLPPKNKTIILLIICFPLASAPLRRVDGS